MICSNAVTKITLSTIQKLGNVRNTPNLFYVLMNIEKKNIRNLLVLILLLTIWLLLDSSALLCIP